MLICGFPTARAFWKIAEDNHAAYEAKHGAGYTATDTGIYKNQGYGMKFFYAAIGLVLGLVANPIKTIKNIFTIKDLKENVSRLSVHNTKWSETA